ncbi:MAG: hypothetical protein RIS41_1326 [Actinomycetota bacterium]
MARWWKRRAASVAPLSNTSDLTGVLGSTWRAAVTPWGDLEFEDGTPPLQWYVAADDRWHHPAREVAVRRRLVDGTPVFETRLRVPRGDVVHTVWSTSVGDVGVTVVDVVNDSALPVAVAFSRADLVTSRPVAASPSGEWPAPGLELPVAPMVLPVGHRSSARVMLRHDGRTEALAGELPEVDSVVRGWLAVAERAGRFVVPDLIDSVPLADRVIAARCQAVLHGGDADTAAERLLDLDERVRANVESAEPVSVAGLVEELLDDLRRGRVDASAARLALAAGARLLADDSRAVDDLIGAVAKFRGTRADDLAGAWGTVDPATSLDVSRHVLPALVHDRLARLTARDTVTLLADGMPTDWYGVSCEAHGIAVGARHRVSFAVRWHGERPAVLWEIDGPPGLVVRTGVDESWSTVESRGEALWHAPRRPPTSLSVGSESFS